MKYYYLIIALGISLLGHLFFLNNINFSFNKLTSDESLFIEMIPISGKPSINEVKKIYKIKTNIQRIKKKIKQQDLYLNIKGMITKKS